MFRVEGETLVGTRPSPLVCRSNTSPKKMLLSAQSAAEIICAISFLQPPCERKDGRNLLSRDRMCRPITHLEVGSQPQLGKRTVFETLSEPPLKRNSLDRRTKGISKRMITKQAKNQGNASSSFLEAVVDDKDNMDQKVRSAYSSRGSSGMASLGPCHHCGETESPQWRKGPAEKPHLCNACGTRYLRKGSLQHSSSRRLSSQPSAKHEGDMTGSPTGPSPMILA